MACAEIEALLGELVVFAGHRPVFDTTAGAAGEAVRRIRPAIAIIDGWLRLRLLYSLSAATM